MSRTAFFTKEDITKQVIELIRKHGIEYLSARNLSRMLGCTVSPLFSTFKNMGEIEQEARKAAEKLFVDYMAGVEDYYPPMKEFALRIIKFSKEETNLYHYLFLTKGINCNIGEEIAQKLMMKDVKDEHSLNEEQCKAILMQMWPFICGVSVLCNKDPEAFSDETVSRLISVQFLSMLHMVTSGKQINPVEPKIVK